MSTHRRVQALRNAAPWYYKPLVWWFRWPMKWWRKLRGDLFPVLAIQAGRYRMNTYPERHRERKIKPIDNPAMQYGMQYGQFMYDVPPQAPPVRSYIYSRQSQKPQQWKKTNDE